MIDPKTLTMLTTLKPRTLAGVLATSGYSGNSFETAAFMGINRDGKFVYLVTFFDEGGEGLVDTGKIFVSFDHATRVVSAEF
jgi:hypothetical protein